MKLKYLLTGLLIFLILSACAPVPVPTKPALPSQAPAASETPPAPTQPSPDDVLRIWVTPRFDPAFDVLLKARLDEFAASHEGLKIEVRVKDESSLVESLRLTVSAAPAVIPDLLLFSRAELESAAAQDLVQPLEGNTAGPENWYPVMRQMGRVGEAAYGIPFAVEALTLATTRGELLPDWPAIRSAGTLVFNVHDVSFPLGLYLSAGGRLTGADGSLQLDEAVLERTLALFAEGGIQALESDEQVADMVKQGSNAGVAWTGSFPLDGETSLRLDSLPGLEAPSATLVDGWTWSVASLDPARRELALELAGWLTDEDFLREWAPALGLLSPYQDARWQPLLESAIPLPPAELLEILDPVLQEAVASVLNGTPPQEAALAALEGLK